MSLQHAAKHLEKHGRNGDTVLVHMSKGEVKSLNDIAMAGGGQLTINPHTGLPEAGFLKSLLPMIAGAGLMAVSGGAINPMTAGLLVGGGTAAATGDIKKGLMAGLGAYGGAGLGSALASSGTQAAAAASPEVLAAQQNAVTNATTLGNTAPNMVPYSPEGFAEAARATTAPIDAARQTALETAKTQFDVGTTGERLSTMGQGVKSLGQPGGFSNLYQNLANDPNTYGAKTTLAAAAAPTLAYAMEPGKPPPETPADSDPGQQYDYMANPTTPTPMSDPYGREQRYFNPRYVPRMADGGITGQGDLQLNIPLDLGGGSGGGGGNGGGATYPFQSSGGFTGNNNAPQVAQQAQAQGLASVPQSLQQQQALQQANMAQAQALPEQQRAMFAAQAQRMATGGISDAGYNLGGYSDGGRLLRGPGDGVSDSIPAVIGKKQPARLADGEFVIPARIVSELGNGSTEAGARKLYAMMDRIQKARSKTVGKGKVAKNSRSEKYLPA